MVIGGLYLISRIIGYLVAFNYGELFGDIYFIVAILLIAWVVLVIGEVRNNNK